MWAFVEFQRGSGLNVVAVSILDPLFGEPGGPWCRAFRFCDADPGTVSSSEFVAYESSPRVHCYVWKTSPASR